ncbi:DUF4386 domain-containing protein [Parasphingopyxis lamellibrachiae]|uniref:Uncharacterized protein DUF4386 n=1 Tax=Parasphingopyxis lamellibrachiae TaxID=680125 RepID=A0A3D9FDI7_9SPHN|nr:DUF4386 domain-containing protein [Parasphingopyxis lamellibrachiae]RED15728.1 uncharacterized protein DUF4386 [Parasphingopyxis lamellibrachiae]
MQSPQSWNPQILGRSVGWTLIGTIVIGILSALFVVQGIDINLSANVAAVAEAMQDAELRLRAKAYVALLLFSMEIFILAGLFLLLRKAGELLASWSLFVGLTGSILSLLGAVLALNGAEISSDPAYTSLASDTQLTLLGLQATTDYTSFHLGLVLSSISKAGFFALFLRSGLIPRIIAAWGLFASAFVASTIVARDFIPLLGNGSITAAFMLSNLIALVSLGLYLGIRGVRAA